jgi:phosphohistidine phosphatase
MKTLLVLRHAKAAGDAPKGDKDRALTKRGERDAALIAQQLSDIAARPDAVVTSDARRARQTAAIVAAAIGFAPPLTIEPALYAAGVDTLLQIVRELPDTAGCVLLVGHNPGFEQLSAALSGDGSPAAHLPTAGLAPLEFDVARWSDVRPRTGRLRGIYTPQ